MLNNQRVYIYIYIYKSYILYYSIRNQETSFFLVPCGWLIIPSPISETRQKKDGAQKVYMYPPTIKHGNGKSPMAHF